MTGHVDVTGFGGYPRHRSHVVVLRDPREARPALAGDGVVARGCGRGYGDCAIGLRRTVVTRGLSFFEDLDRCRGLVTVQAGVTIRELILHLAPRGWFPYVVPGTQDVTVGGAIAADVHGKNQHHDGSFGDHVESLELVTPHGERLLCSPRENVDWFRATVGGMGLTGLIVRATIRLRPIETGWILGQAQATTTLEELLDAVEAARESRYVVAWLDAANFGRLGSGLVLRGQHASRDQIPRDLPRFPRPRQPRRLPPVPLERGVLTPLLIRSFNRWHSWRGSRRRNPSLQTFEEFFFPLDALDGWNRLYGQRGFLQYQFVVTDESAPAALQEMFAFLRQRNCPPFLAVMKKFGRRGKGLLSFPRPGWTLALDFPRDDASLRLLERLDDIVAVAGGTVYLAKDARLQRGAFDRMTPEAEGFRTFREQYGLTRRLRSRLAERLAL